MAAIVRSSGDAIVSTDSAGVVTSWNAAAERLLGYPPEEIVGRPGAILVPPCAEDVQQEVAKRFHRGEDVVTYDTWCLRRDGSLVEVEATLSAVRGGEGEITGFAASLRDLSERRRVEDALADARATEEVAAERDRIARDLHDLVIQRLFASGLALQALLASGREPGVSAQLQKVVDSLDETIHEIRSTIFSLGRKASRTSGTRVRVLELAADSADALGFTPHVHFQGPIDTAVPDEVAQQILAVVREALSNIARHAFATRAQVDLSAGSDLVITVIDDGKGIGPATRRSGLDNLAIRAEELGGTFEAGPGPEGGTRIVWRVPLVVTARR